MAFPGSSSCLNWFIITVLHNAPLSGRASKSRYFVHFTWFVKGSGGVFLVQCRDVFLFVGCNDWITDLTSNYQDTTLWQIGLEWIPLFNALCASHNQHLIYFPNPNAFTLASRVNHVIINSEENVLKHHYICYNCIVTNWIQKFLSWNHSNNIYLLEPFIYIVRIYLFIYLKVRDM